MCHPHAYTTTHEPVQIKTTPIHQNPQIPNMKT